MKLFIRSCFDREAIPLPFNQEALIDIENYPRLTLSSFTNKQNLVSRKDGAGKNLFSKRDRTEKKTLSVAFLDQLFASDRSCEGEKIKQSKILSVPTFLTILDFYLCTSLSLSSQIESIKVSRAPGFTCSFWHFFF